MMMAAVNTDQRKRIHPLKFTLWAGMASIIMMFAGMTSAYIVKRSQSNWLQFDLPVIFIWSTIVILLGSLFIHLALKWFRARNMRLYRLLINATALLGVAFITMQFIGFMQLQSSGVQLFGKGSNPAASFLGVIVGLHLLHVLGGVIAILIQFFKSYRQKVKTYSSLSIELAATYWHFVDILWLYLFVFLMWL